MIEKPHLNLISFLEWRDEYQTKKKKKEQNDEPRSSQTSHEIWSKNGEGQGFGHNQEITIQGADVLLCSQFKRHRNRS